MYGFDDAYREHCDHDMGSATEMQNAFAMSQMTRRPDDSSRIHREVERGRFVVVLEGSDYCLHTDALMGSRKVFGSSHATRAEAELAAHAEGERMEDDEVSVYILPRQAPPRRDLPTRTGPAADESGDWEGDEIPF